MSFNNCINWVTKYNSRKDRDNFTPETKLMPFLVILTPLRGDQEVF